MNHSSPPTTMNRKPVANNPNLIEENQPFIRNDANMKTNFSQANSNQMPMNPVNNGNNNNNNNNSAAATTAAARPEANANKQTPASSKMKQILKDNLILVLTIAGIFGGVALGIVGRVFKPKPEALVLLSFPGELLLRVLKMLILPLIISSLISGLAQLDPKSSGKMGSRALGFYIMTTVIATITGIIVALIVHPGSPDANKMNRPKKVANPATDIQVSTLDAMLDIIRNMFPENIVQACSQQVGTTYKKVKKAKQVADVLINSTTTSAYKITNQASIIDSVSSTATPTTLVTAASEELFEYVVVRELKYTDGTNVMGLVVFCIIFGIFISHSKSEAQIMFDFFLVLNELIMKVVALIMWYSPVGILFLVATNIIKIDNMAETARRLSYYMMTVILGLIIHALCTIQLMYFLATRKNPLRFLKGMLQAWLTAVGTASSSATLPITFRCLEENNKVDKRVTRFMLPLGATVNMDGTALYQCVATLFIAQINGIELSFGQLVAVCLSATATSIGVASIPSAALVTMLIVLSTVGLPTEDISYIVAVDWLLDRLRTSINVLGDAYGCGIVAHFSRNELRKLDEEAECEFAQIISASSPPPMMVTTPGHMSQFAYGDDQTFYPNPVLNNPIISVCDETKYDNPNNQNMNNNNNNTNNNNNNNNNNFNNNSNVISNVNNSGGNTASTISPGNTNRGMPLSESINLQQQFNEFRNFERRSSKQAQQPPAVHTVVADAPAPSVVVMDAVRRRSRVLLFSSKIPASVKSMPQIANYASANVNVNALNQDSNV